MTPDNAAFWLGAAIFSPIAAGVMFLWMCAAETKQRRAAAKKADPYRDPFGG